MGPQSEMLLQKGLSKVQMMATPLEHLTRMEPQMEFLTEHLMGSLMGFLWELLRVPLTEQ